ncbi:hypothetical protein Ddye_010068 [Dipteronia dyeriana]|uniref:Uncharacterized protein n=1 Tax=Dipteronia dyeriana TaxID=168575 RepID=A0AAD9XCI7_9ROSI|nr:hypothetical protein Ddye_010068 [Dipteronia dyeriana]
MQHHHIQPFCVSKLKAMNTNILQTLVSKSPPSTILVNPATLSTTTTTPQSQNLPKLGCYFGRSLRINPINSSGSSSNTSSDGNDAPQSGPPPITPPNPVEIRFRSRSRRQRQRSEEGARDNKQSLQASAAAAAKVTKKWEDMSLTEKAIELYVGEKGALFWLNKFAYASIFIMIGAWIMFRFVGPALNLYQLDSAPLPPSSIIKGS